MNNLINYLLGLQTAFIIYMLYKYGKLARYYTTIENENDDLRNKYYQLLDKYEPETDNGEGYGLSGKVNPFFAPPKPGEGHGV